MYVLLNTHVPCEVDQTILKIYVEKKKRKIDISQITILN